MKWVVGVVVRGSGRGRKLGFPTANVRLNKPGDRPAPGIYACWARLSPASTAYKAALHVGPRPSFSDNRITVEIHLLNHPDRDLYGQLIEFCCLKKLRDVKKFATIEALQSAMTEDCRHASQALDLAASSHDA
jgi:riboflavin kinase / FMN adenylyltransferase